MKTEVIDVSATRKEIKIEIDAATVRTAFDSISERYAKLANVPGFRRGHTPRSVVQTRFKDEIRSELLRELVPHAIQEAIENSALKVIGEPDIHFDNDEGLGKIGKAPLSFHADVDVLPEFELGEYKGLKSGRSVRPVTDEDIANVIDGLRETYASLQPVEDRPSKIGDTVTVTVHGVFVETPDAEPIDAPDIDVILGGAGVQQEFTDNLTGTQVDDEKEFTVKYPEDFTAKGLAGKTVDYTAKVTAVRVKELPEVDDEWASSLGEEFETVEVMRQKIREDLETRADREADTRLRNKLMNVLIEGHQIELPASLVEYQAHQLTETAAQDIAARGVDPRQMDASWWEGVRERMKPQAEHDLRGSMLLERVADEENLEVSDDEVASEIEGFATASNQPIEQVRDALTKQGGERSIANRLRNRKALEFLVENANVTSEEWREEIPETDEANKDVTAAHVEAETDQQTVDEANKPQTNSASSEP